MNLENEVHQLLDNQLMARLKNDEEQLYTKAILNKLGVNNGEFYELYTQYFLRLLDRRSGTPEMIDPCPPQDMLGTATFAHNVWGFPKNYILFTTGEGEGGYFYNVDDNSVWDCGLGEQHLLGTDQLKHWDSFYEFMVWYLTVDEDEWILSINRPNHFELQNDKFNLSHQGENKSLEGLDRIKKDMQKFLNERGKPCKLDHQTNQCKKI